MYDIRCYNCATLLARTEEAGIWCLGAALLGWSIDRLLYFGFLSPSFISELGKYHKRCYDRQRGTENDSRRERIRTNWPSSGARVEE